MRSRLYLEPHDEGRSRTRGEFDDPRRYFRVLFRTMKSNLRAGPADEIRCLVALAKASSLGIRGNLPSDESDEALPQSGSGQIASSLDVSVADHSEACNGPLNDGERKENVQANYAPRHLCKRRRRC